jgi:hypothetical protein
LFFFELFLTGVLLDFRMLAKSAEEGKKLAHPELEHLMALFNTYPPDVNSSHDPVFEATTRQDLTYSGWYYEERERGSPCTVR